MRTRASFDRFIGLNKKASKALIRFLPAARRDLKKDYEEEINRLVRECEPGVIVDVGGGKRCPYAGSLPARTFLFGLDIEEESVRQNEDVDGRVVADLTGGIPLTSGSVDLITSRVTLEHLPDLRGFFREVKRVLRPGGLSVHVFPGRYASFAIISRLLGERLSRRVLFFLRPRTKGTCGYRAYYDRTHYGAVQRIHAEAGLEVMTLKVSFHASDYYGFFLPAFLLSALYETIIQWLGLKNLAAYILVVARKPQLVQPSPAHRQSTRPGVSQSREETARDRAAAGPPQSW